MTWQDWIKGNWAALSQGEKVEVPRFLPHPELAGFRAITIAAPEGQVADWGVSMSDGSRLHVHQLPNGAMLAHRDKHDPDRGLLDAVAHLLTETFVGPVVLGAVGIFVVRAMIRSDG